MIWYRKEKENIYILVLFKRMAFLILNFYLNLPYFVCLKEKDRGRVGGVLSDFPELWCSEAVYHTLLDNQTINT